MNAITPIVTDLSDERLFADGPPHELFARLRAEAPVHWSEPEDGPGFWSVTRAGDIAAVSRDTETFSSHEGGIWLHEDTLAPLDVLRNLLIFKDPPEHTKYRLLVQKVFTPRVVARLEPAVRRRTVRLLDAVGGEGRADLVRDVAVPLPLETIAELLGIEDAEIPRMIDWTERLERGVADSRPDGVAALGEMAEFLSEMVPRRRADPRDDLVTSLAEAEIEGERLTDVEMTLFFAILVFAGNDTTRNTISGGTLALLERPDQLGKLREDRALIPSAVEEMLRWVSAIQYFARTATRDTELGGQRIKAGQRLLLWYGSGCRDERVYDRPDEFIVDRVEHQHQAFGGGGRHFCLGSGLARLELRVYLEELLDRVPDLQADGPPSRIGSLWVNGLTSLPVRFTPAGNGDHRG